MLIHSLKKAALILVSVAAVTGALGFRAGWVPAIRGGDEGAAAPRQAEDKTDNSDVPSTPLPNHNPEPQPPVGFGDPRIGQMPPYVPPKNFPNLGEQGDPIPVLGSQSILMVESPDSKGVAAMSTDAGNGDWKRYVVA